MSIMNIYFSGRVSEDSVNLLFDVIQENIKKGGIDINLILSSSGGEVIPAIAFYYKIKNNNFNDKLTVYNPSMIGSAATLIYLAFTKRVVLPSTLFMVHSIAVKSGKDAQYSIAILNDMLGEIFEETTSITKLDYADIIVKYPKKYYTDQEVMTKGISNLASTTIPQPNIYFGI